jgi:hypothetical protein
LKFHTLGILNIQNKKKSLKLLMSYTPYTGQEKPAGKYTNPDKKRKLIRQECQFTPIDQNTNMPIINPTITNKTRDLAKCTLLELSQIVEAIEQEIKHMEDTLEHIEDFLDIISKEGSMEDSIEQ